MTHKEFLQNVGMEIMIARIRKGLSNPELSKLTGLSIAGLQKVERGKFNSQILTYKRIADALGISLKDIM